MSSLSSDQKVRVACSSCGARFKAPAEKAGRKGKCPKCGAIFVVPSPSPAGQPVEEVDWSAVTGQEAAPEEDPVLALAAAASPSGSAGNRGGSKAPTSVLDGLTPEQRQMLAARVQEKMTKDFQRFEEEEPAGSFPTGIVAAIFCALLGSGLWFGIFAGTGRELRFMSLALGVLAGGGMYLGFQRRSSTAAMVAAAVALGAIVAAKVAFVSWGEPFKVAAMPPPKVNTVEQEIDDEYVRPDPQFVAAAITQWVNRDYMYEKNLTYRTMGNTEWERQRHEWAMIDRGNALTAEQGFEVMYRWNYYTDHLPQQQRQAEREWDAAEQAKAAEAAMKEDPAASGEEEAADAGSTSAGVEGAGDALRAEEQEEEPLSLRSYDWSPEKKAAMEKTFADLERSFFMEVKEMPVEDLKAYYDEQREAERRARKIAAKQAGEEIEEKFVELGEDPLAAAAAAEEAKKYQPIDVQDIIAIPLALAAAWFLGRGWN